MKTLKIVHPTGKFVDEVEVLDDVKIVECEDAEYADTMKRARLTVELHNRDFPDDEWQIQEVSEVNKT